MTPPVVPTQGSDSASPESSQSFPSNSPAPPVLAAAAALSLSTLSPSPSSSSSSSSSPPPPAAFMDSPTEMSFSGQRSHTFPAFSARVEMPFPRGYHSPLRQHHRTQSLGPREVKETLDACLHYDDDESGPGMRINQYTIKQEIGRGSFGAVHLAVDQTDQQYAMKEFSKSRLRKQCQSNILRRPHHARGRGRGRLGGFGLPSHRRSASQVQNEEENGNPLYLIREEIAILKKLDHENIVKLYEVLDDRDGDSLYMVMEYCPKGVVLKLDPGEQVRPYPEEKCRHFFRDMILGIEYLHSQGIIHRDIKPDNLLLAEDDCIKIVDFGVSEMFKKGTIKKTAKSAGSPAFLPPELCRSGHGDIDGEAADIWSMGVTLYCLCVGKLPFYHMMPLDVYRAILNDEPDEIPDDLNLSDDLKALFRGIFEKDPTKRLKMSQLREHDWVTRNGLDLLLSYEENTTDWLLPTEEEVRGAITKSIRHIMTVVKAVNKLKRLTARNRGPRSTGHPTRDLQRIHCLGESSAGVKTATCRQPAQAVQPDPLQFITRPRRMDSAVVLDDGEGGEYSGGAEAGQGITSSGKQPLPYLTIGTKQNDSAHCIVSESPTSTDEDLFEKTYGTGVLPAEAASTDGLPQPACPDAAVMKGLA